MADLTKEMFSKCEVKLNGKQDVEQTLLKIFLTNGFDLTVSEIQEFMDIKPHYIYSNMKNNFDYIICPKHSTQIFKKINVPDEILSPSESKKVFDKPISFVYSFYDTIANIQFRRNDLGSLSRVRMLISRTSFLQYLLNDLKVSEARVKVKIKDEDIPKNITSKDIINILDNLEYVSQGYPLVHIILKLTFVYQKEKLRSPLTLRKELTEINGGIEIHDSQMYRWLKNKTSYIKLELTSVSEQKPVVRYLVDSSTYKEDKGNKNLFSVDSRKYHSGLYEAIVKEMNRISLEKSIETKKDTNK